MFICLLTLASFFFYTEYNSLHLFPSGPKIFLSLTTHSLYLFFKSLSLVKKLRFGSYADQPTQLSIACGAPWNSQTKKDSSRKPNDIIKSQWSLKKNITTAWMWLCDSQSGKTI